jgi:DNA modification methylase
MKRHSIGIDLKPEYVKMVKQELKGEEAGIPGSKNKNDSIKPSRRHAVR